MTEAAAEDVIPTPTVDGSQDVPADAAQKTVAAAFGEIVWLLSQDPAHRGMTLGELEEAVMPPILLRQFRIYYTAGQPVAAVLLARASEEVAARVAAGDVRLTPQEWRSGEREVVVRTTGNRNCRSELRRRGHAAE